MDDEIASEFVLIEGAKILSFTSYPSDGELVPGQKEYEVEVVLPNGKTLQFISDLICDKSGETRPYLGVPEFVVGEVICFVRFLREPDADADPDQAGKPSEMMECGLGDNSEMIAVD